MPPGFIPAPPPGFEIAGTFNGVTTAVGTNGERIRYRLTQVSFPSGGLIGFATRLVLRTGVGDEVALGGLHHRLSTALMMVGDRPEAGMPERLREESAAGLVLGRYLDRESRATRYGAMALVKGKPGMVEILVTECDSEDVCRRLVHAAVTPYLRQ
jgi:hypothetical protein